MVSSLSNLANKLPVGIHKIKCKNGHDNKKCKTCGIKCKNYECCLENTNVKDDLILYKRLSFKRSYQKNLNENLKKWFANTCTFSNHVINKFYLLLQKVIYPK